jgi:hypothetical protein
MTDTDHHRYGRSYGQARSYTTVCIYVCMYVCIYDYMYVCMYVHMYTYVTVTVGPALGYWVKEGVGLVVHFPLEDVAKINTP